MDAERIKEIIKSDVMHEDESSLGGCCLFSEPMLVLAIQQAASEIANEIALEESDGR